MTAEPFSYRARKWAIQQLTTAVDRSDQHERLVNLDWDVVVVLDACRWDTLQEVAPWPIDRAQSPASATDEWLQVAAETGIFSDAHITTGNANYARFDLGEDELVPVWNTDWNDELETVLPEPVLESADELLESGQTPVVAHLLPPHAPYVARLGGDWRLALTERGVWGNRPDLEGERGEKLSAQVAMSTGAVDLERAKAAYEASVVSTWNVVAEFVGRWLDAGHEVVVTADHGEVFGRWSEWKLYGHPNRCHVAPLVTVPFEHFSPATGSSESPETVEEQLKALGYAD